MARKGKQVSRKGKAEIPEEDEKQNEMILEEVLSISGKSSEKADGSTPARQKRASSKSKEIVATEPKKLNAKKRSLSPSSLPPKKKKSFNKQEEGEVTTAVNEVKTTASERGDPVPNLPDGWRRQVAVRKSGKSAGQIDIYFFSPDGVKLRSRPDVLSYLKLHKSSLKIEEFDFSKGNRASKATEKATASESKKKSATENNSVPKKKTVHDEKSKVKVEPKELSKNTATKMSKSVKKASEVPAVPETEENDATGKVILEKKITKAEEKTSRASTSRKRQSEALEDKKQKSKKFKKEESSSAKLKKKNEKKSESKKVDAKKEKPTKDAVNEVKTSVRGIPVPNLPDGWRREVVARKSGGKAGQIDIYFYSPDGVKLRSRPDVLSYLKKRKSDLKIEDFDFSRTAKTIAATVKKESNVGMDSSENMSAKDSKTPKKLSAKVPEPTGKPSKILRKILESKSKKLIT